METRYQPPVVSASWRVSEHRSYAGVEVSGLKERVAVVYPRSTASRRRPGEAYEPSCWPLAR